MDKEKVKISIHKFPFLDKKQKDEFLSLIDVLPEKALREISNFFSPYEETTAMNEDFKIRKQIIFDKYLKKMRLHGKEGKQKILQLVAGKTEESDEIEANVILKKIENE